MSAIREFRVPKPIRWLIYVACMVLALPFKLAEWIDRLTEKKREPEDDEIPTTLRELFEGLEEEVGQ